MWMKARVLPITNILYEQNTAAKDGIISRERRTNYLRFADEIGILQDEPLFIL